MSIGQQILITNATVSAGLGERDVGVFEQFHEVGVGDVQSDGGFLRG